MNATNDWYWEGNIVDAIANFLEKDNWVIISKANAHTKQRGVDLHAVKNGRMLLIEAKGFPSRNYRDISRAKEQKPTHPTSQAQHWYSHALLKVVRLQTKHPEAIVAIGLPDFPRYQTLVQETRNALGKLRIVLLIVQEDGTISIHDPNKLL